MLTRRGPTGIGPYTGGTSAGAGAANLVAWSAGQTAGQALAQVPTQALLPPPPSAPLALPPGPAAGGLGPIELGPSDFYNWADYDLQKAVDKIHTAQYGYNTQNGRLNPITLTLTENNRVILSQVSKKPGPLARTMAEQIFGNVEFVAGQEVSNVPMLNGHHAEPRGIKYADLEVTNAKQASSHYACPTCEATQNSAGVINVTGFKSVTGTIGRKKIQ